MRTTILIAATLLTTTAFAQAPATNQWIELDDDAANIVVLGTTIDQIEEMDVLDAQGTKIGEVGEVLGTDATTPTALAIDLEGADDLDVVVELSAFQLQNNQLTTTLTADQLRALPVWND